MCQYTKTLPLQNYVCASTPRYCPYICVPVHQDTAPTCVCQYTKTLPLHMCVPVHQDTAPIHNFMCASTPRHCPYICVCQYTKTLPKCPSSCTSLTCHSAAKHIHVPLLGGALLNTLQSNKNVYCWKVQMYWIFYVATC